MSSILRFNSKKLIEFLTEYRLEEFQFILISEDITSVNRYKNVMSITALIPPPNVIAPMINDGDKDDYKKKYFNYLRRPEVTSLITIMVKAALDGMNIVLLCSKNEDELKYLKLLGEFIEDEFKFHVYTFKEFDDDPVKAIKIKNPEEVGAILAKKLERLKEDIGDVKINPSIDRNKIVNKLKDMEKDELVKYCSYRGIKIKKGWKKKDIIKKIVKKLMK